MTDLPLPDCLIDYSADTQSLMGSSTALLTYSAMPVSFLIECIKATQGGTPVRDKHWILNEVRTPDGEAKQWVLDGTSNMPLIQSQPRTLVLGGVPMVENVALSYVWTEEKRLAEQSKNIRDKVRHG